MWARSPGPGFRLHSIRTFMNQFPFPHFLPSRKRMHPHFASLQMASVVVEAQPKSKDSKDEWQLFLNATTSTMQTARVRVQV